MADYITKQFFGTAVEIANIVTDVGASNFSGASNIFDNTTDATVPYAQFAVMTARIPDFAAAPVVNTPIEIWGVPQDTMGTDDDGLDETVTNVSVPGAKYMGAWILAAADQLQQRTTIVDLTGIRKIKFYFKNGTAQNLNNDGTNSFLVNITPMSYGVTA